MANRRIKRTKSFSSYLNAVAQDVSKLQAKNDITSIGSNTITGDSLAENLTLFGTAIQSSTYVPGELGWKIDGTGIAEFGSVFVRGDINAETGTIGYWNISSPAVTRTIGSKTLYGTFLESSDLGYNDITKDSGAYVGMFKSYTEDALSVSSVNRAGGVATLYVPGHNYQLGDLVLVAITTVGGVSDTSFNNGGNPVEVIEVRGDSILYTSDGTDTDLVADTIAVGTAQLYTEDIAGLYMKDYTKNLFDYAYMSNKGLAYVGAQKLNLIYNPSFEYLNTSTNVITSSASSWTYNGGLPTIHDFSADTIGYYGYLGVDQATGYYHSSLYGGKVTWSTTALTSPISATIGFSEGDTYRVFASGRSLYLGLDMFLGYTPVSSTITNVSPTSSSSVTVTTSTAHGLVAGDLVYLDVVYEFLGIVGIVDVQYIYTYNGATNGQVFSVVSAPTTTTFTIANVPGTTQPSNNVRDNLIDATDGGGRTPKAYKVYYPAFDMSGIKIRYSNASTTNLSDILTAETLALWTANSDEKYMKVHPRAWMEEYLLPKQGIDPLTSSQRVLIDSDALAFAYSTADPTGYAAKSPIYLDIPPYLYKQALTGSFTSTTKITGSNTLSLIIDSASLSTEAKMFFGDKSIDYNWYDDSLNSPDQVSVESPRHWIDIDLDAQTGIVSNLDYIGFKSSRFTKSLSAQPSISTKSDYTRDVVSTMPTGDYEYLHISSGQYTYSTTANYSTYESYSNYVVSPTNSVAELVASTKVSTPAGAIVSTKVASIVAESSDGTGTSVTIRAPWTYIFNDLSVGTSAELGTLQTYELTNYTGGGFPLNITSDIALYLNAGTTMDLTSIGIMTLSAGGGIDVNSTSRFSSASYWGANSPIVVGDGQQGALISANNGYGGFFRDSTSGAALYVGRTGGVTGTVVLAQFYYNTVATGRITVASGGTPAFTSGSDYRMKENIVPVTDAISRMKNAKAYTFNKIESVDPEKNTQTGFIAHELADVLPDAVFGEKDAVDENGNPIYQEIAEAKIVPVMAQAINDLIGMVESLTERVKKLEK